MKLDEVWHMVRSAIERGEFVMAVAFCVHALVG